MAKLGKTDSLWCLLFSNFVCLILKIYLILNRGIISERQKMMRRIARCHGYLKGSWNTTH